MGRRVLPRCSMYSRTALGPHGKFELNSILLLYFFPSFALARCMKDIQFLLLCTDELRSNKYAVIFLLSCRSNSVMNDDFCRSISCGKVVCRLADRQRTVIVRWGVAGCVCCREASDALNLFIG